ncbi:MAG: hypothetical protein WCS97_03175 [Candidatus Paceibacterota bacterium]
MERINKNEGVVSFLGLMFTILTFVFANQKLWALGVFALFVFVVGGLHMRERRKSKCFDSIRKTAKILFIDDKHCEIVTSLRRNNFDVRKIDDIRSLTADPDVQWANLILVDYKDVGKKLFGKKEGLGLISELKRIYGNKKRYVIYSSVQDFDGLVEFPYIRKNASYDEFISLISTEVGKL